MKKVNFIVLSLLISVAAWSQTVMSVPANSNLKRPAPSAIGTIWDETSWSSLGNYSNVGSGISVTGGHLAMSGGTASFTDYLLLTGSTNFNYSSVEKWTVSVKFSITTNSTSYGPGIGIRCANSFAQMNAIFRWSCATSGETAQYYCYPNNSLTAQQTQGSSGHGPASGTTYYFDVTRNKNVYTCKSYQSDHTTQVGSTGTFTMSMSSGTTNQTNNTGQWVIENFGGTMQITEWKITIDENKNPDYLFIGDSNMSCCFPGSTSARFAEAAATAKSKTFVIDAGIGDRTADVLNRITEARAINPKYAMISIGRNDIANSVPLATTESNIDNIISILRGYGIVVRLGGVPASNVDVSSLQTWYNGKSNLQVNSYTTTKSGTTTLNAAYNSGDGIHLNSAGNSAMSTLWQTIIY